MIMEIKDERTEEKESKKRRDESKRKEGKKRIRSKGYNNKEGSDKG